MNLHKYHYHYDKAFFKGSIEDVKEAKKYVKINNSRGFISLSDIQDFYKRNWTLATTILYGHLWCPDCKHVMLYYTKNPMKGRKGFLRRSPGSNHLPGCHYDKQSNVHGKYISNHYNHRPITNANANNFLEDAFKRAIKKLIKPRFSKGLTNTNTSSGGDDHSQRHDNSASGDSSKIKNPPSFTWNHAFYLNDDKLKCILFGTVDDIKISHKNKSYIDKHGIKKYKYKTTIDINKGTRIIWGLKKEAKPKKEVPPEYFKGCVVFSALCYIRPPYVDLINYLDIKPYKIYILTGRKWFKS